MSETTTAPLATKTARPIPTPELGAERRAPFLIVGCPRSGTTLVAQILDCHSHLAVYLETQFYPVFRSVAHYYGDLARESNLRRFAADVLRQVSIQGVEAPELGPFIDSIQDHTFDGVFAALVQDFATSQGKAWGGEKTPTHCIHLEEIFRAFPDCKVIFLMRDPRDVVYSMQKEWDTKAQVAANIWNQCFESFSRFQDRVLLVRYESLVEQPEDEIRSFCSHLGLDIEPGLFKHYENIPEHVRKRHPNMGLLDRPVSSSSIGNFREMSEERIAAIEKTCAEGMAKMGYEPVASASPASSGSFTNSGEPGFVSNVIDRIRYYGFDRERWRRGSFRWKLQLWLPLRYWLTLGPILKSKSDRLSATREF